MGGDIRSREGRGEGGRGGTYVEGEEGEDRGGEIRSRKRRKRKWREGTEQGGEGVGRGGEGRGGSCICASACVHICTRLLCVRPHSAKDIMPTVFSGFCLILARQIMFTASLCASSRVGMKSPFLIQSLLSTLYVERFTVVKVASIYMYII